MASTTGTLDKFFYRKFLQGLSNKELTCFLCNLIEKAGIIQKVPLDGKEVNLV